MLVSTSPLFLAESLAQLCHVGFALHVNERHAGVVCFAEGIVAVEEIPVDALLHWAKGIEDVYKRQAESCTAGRIASVITAVPGSSNYYRGGLVCYADDVKVNLLKVSSTTIEEQTAVCEDVVRQMVIGANELFHTDYSVAISGFAGPGLSLIHISFQYSRIIPLQQPAPQQDVR